jgi:hypothetical protein
MSNTTTTTTPPWVGAKLLDANPPLTPEEQYIKDGEKAQFNPNHPLNASGFQGILTIDIILRLVSKVTESLQGLAVVKADKVQKILVPWQNAISEEMASVHTFVRNTDSPDISGNTDPDKDKKQSAARDDMNRKNSARTETLRSNRSMVTDEIKNQQTGLQSLQDTLNQLKNLFDTLISKISGINTAIFR